MWLFAAFATHSACGARSSLEHRAWLESDRGDDSSALEPSLAPPVLDSSAPQQSPPAASPITSATPSTAARPDVPKAPTATYDGWASCRNPLKLDFAGASGGIYTSFSGDAVDTVITGCGVGKDVVFSWRAPHDGYYAFSAPNTEYDAVLALLADTQECSPSLACATGRAMSSGAYLERHLSRGETLKIALESTDTGRFSLMVGAIEQPRR